MVALCFEGKFLGLMGGGGGGGGRGSKSWEVDKNVMNWFGLFLYIFL